jgi:prephenate dehydrogenase
VNGAVASDLAPRALTVALIGCGHMGGSLIMALRAARRLRHVVGFDREARVMQLARELRIIDEAAPSAAAAVELADVVFLAVPVRALGEVCAAIAPAVRAGAIVTDVGSLKDRVVRVCEENLGDRARFVGGHPMAGTEKSGPEHAQSRLYKGRTVILTPTERTSAAALKFVTTMWQATGAQVVELSPAAHDKAVAALSHLPHLLAFALAGTVDAEAEQLQGLAGGSFTDATRVASSSPAMWAPLLIDNRDFILPWLESFGAKLESLRYALHKRDASALAALIERAGGARKKIVGP